MHCRFARLLIALLFMFISGALVSFGQTAPNLTNGLPPGSYDDSSIDSVNLMNGNLMLHIPLPVGKPQRGDLAIKYYLVVNAKTWEAIGDPNTLIGQWTPTSACSISSTYPPTTGPCGQGPVFVSTASFGMNRVYSQVYEDGVGTDYNVSTPDKLITWDGSAHNLVESATTGTLVTDDGSGYQIIISGSNAFGLPYDAVIIDRLGTRYIGGFSRIQGTCVRDPGNGLPGYTSTTTCTEHFRLSQVIDANGNVLDPPLGIPDIGAPMWNGPSISTHEAIGTESNGCLTSFGMPWVAYLSYAAPNGQTNQIKLCFAIYPQLATSFSPPNIHQFQEDYSGHPFPGNYRQPVYLSNVILPDNTQWSISYDSYGEITYLTTPTGTFIQYSWAEGQFPKMYSTDITTVSRAVHTRSVHDVTGNVFTWMYQWDLPDANSIMSHTVNDPNGNDTVHIFSPIQIRPTLYPYNFKETQTVRYSGAGGARSPLQQVDTTWVILPNGGYLGVPTDIKTTIFPSQKVSLVHKEYDISSPSFELVTSEKDYDWGQGAPGALLREEDIVYQWQKDSRYLAANMLTLPASTIVVSPVAASNTKANCPVDAVGTLKPCIAETDYTYDEAAYLTSYENTVGTLPTGTHLAAPNPVRGNLTTESRWLSTSNAFVSSHTNWYDTGEVYKNVDPLNHGTTHYYDLAYAGVLPTRTCNAKNQCVSATYDMNTGLITSFSDENAAYAASGTSQGDPAHTSTYAYDYMSHMTSTVAPADSQGRHPQTIFTYVNPTTVEAVQAIDSATSSTVTNHFDGLGHVTRTEHVTSGGTVIVNTVYDGLGHVKSVTNPYVSTSDPTYGVIETTYDGIGRPLAITEQDQSVKIADYSGGNCTTSTDEAGKQHKACSDSLGHLTEVDEPNPGAPATYASGSVVINGFEQTNPQPGASATGTVTVGGYEGSDEVCTDPLPPRLPVCNTLYDIGNVYITVNGIQKSAGYGKNSTASSVAAGLVGAFHNDTSAPVDASCSDAYCTNPVITLTARATGVATNYTLSASPSQSTAPDFWATASGPTLTGGRDASTNPDIGSVTIKLNGTDYKTPYGAGDNGGLLALRLADLINGGNIANAVAAGSTVNIYSKTAGPIGNSYSLSASYTWDSAHFAQPSFTTSPSGSYLSGGFNAGDAGNNPYVTIYSYDALGNLLRVDQKGSASSDSTQWRSRVFTYDSLSRLLTASNPESGTIAFSYDPDSNLVMKTSPTPNQTGSATQSISYCYDELHRVTGKAYSAQTCQGTQLPPGTAVATYSYDVGANAKGKLTGLTDQAGTASYSYEVLGHIASETRVTAGISASLSYEYNLDGTLQKLHYPSGRTVTYAPEVGGRVASVTDSNGTPYASSLTYWPNGTEYQWHLPQIYFRTDLNKRLQETGFYSDNGQVSSFFLNKTYTYGPLHQNNGIIMSIINNKDTSRTQTFAYDSLNRLISAQNAGTNCALTLLNGRTEYWGNSYAYDAWGNLTGKSITKCSGENMTLLALANNRLSGYGYDSAGNLLSDPTDSVTATYDAENRITAAAKAGVTTSYLYDADGNRVKKSNGSTGTIYWYATVGIIAESDLAGNLKSEYVFFNGRRTSRIDLPGNTVHYYLSDVLNSTSMVVSAAGAIESEYEYNPWGGELPFISNDSNHYKFTGKARDSESGLDYFGARYYSSLLGRFITPDWSVKATTVPYAEFSDPQSLNLYSYVRNIPTTRFDPDGHFNDPFGIFDWGDTSRSNILSRFDEHQPGYIVHCKVCIVRVGGNVQRVYQTSKDHQLHQEWIQRVGTSEIILVGSRNLLRPGVEGLPHHTMVAANQAGQTHTWQVLGKVVNGKGTSEDQQVEKDDKREYKPNSIAAHWVYTPMAITHEQSEALTTGLDYWVRSTGNVCPSCGDSYRAWFFSGRLIDGYNSNTFIYNMLAHNPAGRIDPPPLVFAPGYHDAPGNWYPQH